MFVVEEQQLIEFVCKVTTEQDVSLHVGNILLDPFLRPGERMLRWHWNPGGSVGEHRLNLRDGDRSFSWSLRVVPRKIDQDRYEQLLEDLQRSARDLVIALGGGMVGAEWEPTTRPANSVLLSYYTIFEQYLAPFERAVQQIVRAPRERLRSDATDTLVGLADQIEPYHPPQQLEPLPDDAPAELRALYGEYLPARVQERRTRSEFDFYEHRLLRRVIELLLWRAEQLENAATREVERLERGLRVAEAGRIAAGSADAQRRLRELLNLPFMQKISPLRQYRSHGLTNLMLRDPRYHEIWSMWQVLRRSPQIALDAPLFHLPIAELPRLYEYWCVVQLAQALVNQQPYGWAIEVTPNLLIDDTTGIQLTLQPGMVLSATRAGREVSLFYQPRYRPLTNTTSELIGSLDRHTRTPDLSIVARANDALPRLLVFDAKYRVDPHDGYVPQDALADAYAYRLAIGHAEYPLVDRALLLYPSDQEAELYANGVGAIPLLPAPNTNETLTTLLTAWLDSF
jgi:large subunit ribosomal protein MRP49